jgi:hypothetical protein
MPKQIKICKPNEPNTAFIMKHKVNNKWQPVKVGDIVKSPVGNIKIIKILPTEVLAEEVI